MSTELLSAAYKGDISKVRALLAKGADANSKDWKGRTAFRWAVVYGHTEIAILLKMAGAKEPFRPAQL